LGYLVDPATGRSLRLKADPVTTGNWPDGELTGDGRIFAVRKGIPSFLDDSTTADQTVGSFNQKWARHRYYREHTRDFYTRWFLDRYAFFEPDRLANSLRDARFILDAGTGSGRDAVNFALHSTALVYAVDTSWEALSAARRQISDERVIFVHADLHRLPMPDGFFDFINCDQVIHHTPEPRRAFEALTRKLRPGGQMCCYVYRKKSPIREFTDDYVRQRISHLPADEALALCEGFTRLGRTLAGLNLTVEIEEDVPFLGIQKGPMDLQRLFHWHIMKCFWNDEFDFFTNNIINFDWYHPQHCHRFEPDEFRTWFAEGWDILAWDVREAGISCRARRT
jgi:SAM-dependent methyltransferase